jgi:hypothetical protein
MVSVEELDEISAAKRMELEIRTFFAGRYCWEH